MCVFWNGISENNCFRVITHLTVYFLSTYSILRKVFTIPREGFQDTNLIKSQEENHLSCLLFTLAVTESFPALFDQDDQWLPQTLVFQRPANCLWVFWSAPRSLWGTNHAKQAHSTNKEPLQPSITLTISKLPSPKSHLSPEGIQNCHIKLWEILKANLLKWQ